MEIKFHWDKSLICDTKTEIETEMKKWDKSVDTLLI
ncbi:MAG: hypothetical protein SCARUB_03394 [Candidatus Scalindua rubra]|uniref:Uncharacterized protein n=1 Tax=Candidatus Scalindua rubra TaxID=1872076 RepID=A0A1E3X786_9BACT|nr:MAG: hypothetical protein SCARUB_03394 [Candidatus Scalindua rubra]